MKALRISIGIYQIVAAMAALMVVSFQLENTGIGFIGLVFLFCGLSFIAGIFSLVSEPVGWRLTVVNQCFQAIGMSSPILTFMVAEGASLRFHLGLNTTGDTLTDHIVTRFTARLGGEFAISFFHRLPILPEYGVSINVASVSVIIISLYALRLLSSHKIEPAATVPDISNPSS